MYYKNAKGSESNVLSKLHKKQICRKYRKRNANEIRPGFSEMNSDISLKFRL